MEVKKVFMKKKSCHYFYVCILLGAAMGLFAKIVTELRSTNYFVVTLDDIFARLGIWIFAAMLMSVHADTAVIAAVRVFAFYSSMLAAYYGYTVSVLRFYPRSQIMFWSACAVCAPFLAAITWLASRKNIAADLITAAAISIFWEEWRLTTEKDFLISAVYATFIISILHIIPRRLKHYMITFGTVFLLCRILCYTKLLYFIFGNWMIIGNRWNY